MEQHRFETVSKIAFIFEDSFKYFKFDAHLIWSFVIFNPFSCPYVLPHERN